MVFFTITFVLEEREARYVPHITVTHGASLSESIWNVLVSDLSVKIQGHQTAYSLKHSLGGVTWPGISLEGLHLNPHPSEQS